MRRWFQTKRGFHGLLLCCLLLLEQVAVAAHSADNFSFPDSVDVTGVRYQLCSSADMQFYIFVDIGDVALYLADCHHRPFLDQGRLLYFHYNHDFSAEDFRKSGDVLLQRNLSSSEFIALKKPLAAFNRLYQPVQKGDSYLIGTNANGQLLLFLNGRLLGAAGSIELSRNYFQIWFGSAPFDERIKKELLP